MNKAQAFKFNNETDIEIKSLEELEAFLASPNSIGLDNIKESLRNIVQLMMELKGYSTGYALQHLANGEHSYLAMNGTLTDDEKRKRREQDLIDFLRLMEEMLAANFTRLYDHVEKRIETITENIENRIEKLDKTIESAVEAGLSDQFIEKKKKKRKKLRYFKERIEERKEELKEVDTAEEIIQVEVDLKRDIDELRQEVPRPKPAIDMRFNPFETYKKTRDYYYNNDSKYQGGEHKRDEKSRSSGKSSSSDGRDDSSSDSGDKDKGVESPPAPDLL